MYTLKMRLLLTILTIITYVYAQAVTTIVDSTDSENITWNGNWTTMADSVIRGVNTSYWGGSTRTTVTPGDSVEFVFKGHTISYYGDIDVDNAEFTVEFDGVVETRSARHQDGFQSQVLLFWKTRLEDVEHRLVITHNDTAGLWLTVDKFEYVTGSWFSLTMPANGTSSTTTSPSPSSSSIVTSSSATLVGSDSEVISGANSDDDSTPSQAAIIGGVIGAITGAMALFVICFFCIRKRRRGGEVEPIDDDYEKKAIQTGLDSVPTLTPWEYAASRRTGTGSMTQRASDTLNGDVVGGTTTGKGEKPTFTMSTYAASPQVFTSSPLARNRNSSGSTHPVEVDLGLSAVPEDSATSGEEMMAKNAVYVAKQPDGAKDDAESSDSDYPERPWPFSGRNQASSSKRSSSQYKTSGESPRTSKSSSVPAGIIGAFPMPGSLSRREIRMGMDVRSESRGSRNRKFSNSLFSR